MEREASLLYKSRPYKAEPYQNVVVYISMSFYPPSHAFFRDATEEIVNKDAFLSIHQKVFLSFFAWPKMPYRVG